MMTLSCIEDEGLIPNQNPKIQREGVVTTED